MDPASPESPAPRRDSAPVRAGSGARGEEGAEEGRGGYAFAFASHPEPGSRARTGAGGRPGRDRGRQMSVPPVRVVELPPSYNELQFPVTG